MNPRTDTSIGQLYAGGEILTLEPDFPRAAALAVHQGRILAVGKEAECRAVLSARAREHERIDLGGGCLVPGFIDTHLHPVAMIYFEQNADLRDVTSIPGLIERLRFAAARQPDDQWLVGLQLDDESLGERRLPTRHELDAACAGRPLLVMERDGHTVVGNSRALALANITAQSADPKGGHIVREPSGEPAGPCHEAAARLLLGAMPTPDPEAFRGSAERCFARLLSHGITSIGVVLQTDEEGPGGQAARIEAFAFALLVEQLPLSIYSILIGRDVDAVLAMREGLLHAPQAGRRVGGYKIFADGTFGACTACMCEPFADRSDSSGYMALPDEELYRRMQRAHLAGLQICVHAIGDEANRRCIELFERLLTRYPRSDHRHRLEHASLLPSALVARIARLGLAVSAQPLFIASERAWLAKRLGPARARHVYPFRDLLDAGVLVGGASDAPIESTNVLSAIECCVTRAGFETHQAISAEEALRLFTLDAARLQHEEREKGSLLPGKRADLVQLDQNPLNVPAERIGAIRVLRTVIGGNAVYLGDSSA